MKAAEDSIAGRILPFRVGFVLICHRWRIHSKRHMWLNKLWPKILKIFHMNTKFRSFALTILAINLTSCEEPKREVHSEVLGDLNPISHDDRLTSNENKSITVRQEDLAYSLMDADREIFECALEVTDISSAKVAVTKLSRIEKRLKDIYDELQTMTPHRMK